MSTHIGLIQEPWLWKGHIEGLRAIMEELSVETNDGNARTCICIKGTNDFRYRSYVPKALQTSRCSFRIRRAEQDTNCHSSIPTS